jgi:hypothetical protein
MVFLTGVGLTTLAVSAMLLRNYSIGALFVLAAIRCYVSAYLDIRKEKGKPVANWVPWYFCGLFVALNVVATGAFIMWYYIQPFEPVMTIKIVNIPIEIAICATLTGLVIGNALKGSYFYRVSFIANRCFNIVNHIVFANLIGVIIAVCAIVSNVWFFVRLFIRKIKG